jgi:hypothetical protein
VARVEERGDSIAISNPVTLFENIRIDAFDVSHDGERILANLVPEQETAQPVTMVTNWTAMLERK